MLYCCACPEVLPQDSSSPQSSSIFLGWDMDKETNKKNHCISCFWNNCPKLSRELVFGWLVDLFGVFFCLFWFGLDIFGGLAGIQDTNFASKDICWEDAGHRLLWRALTVQEQGILDFQKPHQKRPNCTWSRRKWHSLSVPLSSYPLCNTRNWVKNQSQIISSWCNDGKCLASISAKGSPTPSSAYI